MEVMVDRRRKGGWKGCIKGVEGARKRKRLNV
jgi:hypothetical protein